MDNIDLLVLPTEGTVRMPTVRASLHRLSSPGPLVAVSLAYLLLVSGVMIWRGISVSPDYLLLILVPVALLSGHFLRFLRDWVPFIALFLGYEALRDVVPKTHIPVHYGFAIRADKAMFGRTDPTRAPRPCSGPPTPASGSRRISASPTGWRLPTRSSSVSISSSRSRSA